MSDQESSLIIQITIIILLTTINALFAAAELAIVSSKKTKIKLEVEKGNKKAALLLKLLDDPTSFLSSIQVAITFAGFLSSASAATTIAKELSNKLMLLNIPYSSQLSVILVTVLLSLFILLFGELLPKRIAIISPEKIAFRLVPLVYSAYIVFKPIVLLLSKTTHIILKVLGINKKYTEEEVSEEEIKANIYMGTKQGLLEDEDSKMIMSIFDFDDEIVDKILVPRNETYLLEIEDLSYDKLIEAIDTGYSRIPVYEDREDNIIGILYVKDLLKLDLKEISTPDRIKEVLRKPLIVPSSKKINKLLKEMQKTKKHFAIIKDEFGGFVGIATIEDIIEEIVGEINDEYDPEDEDIKAVITEKEHTYILDGREEIEYINEELNISIQSELSETVGGLFIELLGFIPEENDKNEYTVKYSDIDDNITLKGSNFENNKVNNVKIIINKNKGVNKKLNQNKE